MCELENAPEMQKCPKTFVHDCRMTGMTSETRVAFEWEIHIQILKPGFQILQSNAKSDWGNWDDRSDQSDLDD